MDKRVQVLKEYELLDTLPESEFDDIVELASVFFRMPISLISLLDSHRQWFKAKIGLDAPETPIEYAFCYHAIQRPEEVMVVPDSWQDDRFKDNPLATGAPHVRFYAGAPLVTDEGYALGTLCVIDAQPRDFSKEQERVLRILADKVIERFEMRKQNLIIRRQVAEANVKLESAIRRLLEAEKIARIGSWNIDLTTNEIYWSPEMYRLYGLSEDLPITFERWRATVHPDDIAVFSRARREVVSEDKPFIHEFRIMHASGEQFWMLSTIQSSDAGNLVGTTLDITARKEAEESRRQYTVALEQMLNTLSHKIRKPVANVLGISNLFGMDTLTDSDVRECMTLLKTAASEIDGYIHELNDFIRDRKIEISIADTKGK